MYNTIRYSLMFLTCLVLTSTVNGDAFDQTVNQIKAVEAKLEQNRTELQEQRAGIEQTLDTEFANHALSGPKSEFESDADYAKRLVQLDAAMAQRRTELKEARLSPALSRRLELLTEIGRLQQTVFPTNNVTVTLGTYNVNEEFFPVDFEVDGYDPVSRTLSINKSDASKLKNNWNRVAKTAHIAIDPGYRRALASVKLQYPPLWENGFTFTFDVVYDLGDNNVIAFSPDGKYLATADSDGYGIADIWTVEDGEKYRKMDHGDWVYAVAFSPDGKYFVSAGRDKTSTSGKAILWEMENGTKVHTLEHPSYVYSASFSPNGEYLLTTRLPLSNIGRANLFLVDSGSWVRSVTYNATASNIRAIVFSPNGKYFATGARRTLSNGLDPVILWETSSGNAVHRFEHKNGVYAVAFNPTETYLAAGNDESVTLWEMNTRRSVRKIELAGRVYSAAFSPDGRFLAVGKSNGYIDFFHVGTEEITLETDIPRIKSIYAGITVYDLVWHPQGNLISDGNKLYRTLLEPVVTDLAAKPLNTRRDVNSDGVIDIDDLVLVASNFGKAFVANANPNPDVNRDGIVNRKDVLEIIKILERNIGNAGKGAPVVHSHRQLVTTLQRWIDEAKQRSGEDQVYQRGIAVLEQILATLTLESVVPTETRLLSNYPNPFNPETWIPYQLSEPAEVSLRIYALNGTLVRTVDFGHQPAGVYQTKSRAAYWDGRNELGERVASGLYFYTLTAGEFTATRKMLIEK